MIQFDFNPQKSAQAAAVLLKLNGGDMDKYLFIKMLYLADKEALAKWAEPITGDSVAMMRYGPVLSAIYDLTKGDCPSCREFWEPYISDADEETNTVSLRSDPGEDELSKAERQILTSVYEKFRGYNWKQMRDYCHGLPEYEDVGDSSKPLRPEQILRSLGKSVDEIKETDARLRQIRLAEMLLANP